MSPLTYSQDHPQHLHDCAQHLQQLALGEEVHKEQQRRDEVVQRPQHGHQDVHIQTATAEHLEHKPITVLSALDK